MFGSKVDFSWCSSILVTMVVIIINACGNLHCTNLVRRSLNSSIGVWMISLTENGISMLCAILWKFKRWFLRLQEKKSFFLRVRDQHHKHQSITVIIITTIRPDLCRGDPFAPHFQSQRWSSSWDSTVPRCFFHFFFSFHILIIQRELELGLHHS